MRKHIETIESQITFVKESKRKLIESNQTHVSQLEKQNAQLRVNLQKAQVECEQYHQQYLQKEKELQTALVQLSGAQVTLFCIRKPVIDIDIGGVEESQV